MSNPNQQYVVKLKRGAYADAGNGATWPLGEACICEKSDGKWILVSFAHERVPDEFVESATPLPMSEWCLG